MDRMDRSGPVYWTLLVLGGLATLNGAVMLLAPAPWFARIAADTGPFNVHLVRDVGAAYATSGVEALWAARNQGWRAPLAAAAALFQLLHAGIHVFEATTSAEPASRLLRDAVGVHLPTLILCAAALCALRPTPQR